MEAIKITVTLLEKEDGVLHPLFHKYEQELQEQPAYIELDIRNGSLIADWNPEVGNGAPVDVWYGLRRQYRISSDLTTDEINSLLTELAPIAQRLVDEIEIQTYGLQDRLQFLSDKAESAEEDMTNACRFTHTKSSGVFDAGDWLAGTSRKRIYAETTDEQLLAMAKEYRSDAYFEDATVNGIDEYLIELRDDLKDG